MNAKRKSNTKLRIPPGAIPEMRARLCHQIARLGAISDQLTMIDQIIRNPETCIATDNTAISVALGTCCVDSVELAVDAESLAEAMHTLESLCS
ncbi:hypothetical protein [Geminisphaera colitermitum]|uniref:hypothetical protein n=1 Tax=Geminisphaera colitermitum TaxID=1148786 RepID=UPI00019654DA|nr:hypothetical protein [Geminisphaera colitermitum]